MPQRGTGNGGTEEAGKASEIYGTTSTRNPPGALGTAAAAGEVRWK